MFNITKSDFKKHLFEYFDQDNKDFNEALDRLDNDEYLEIYIQDVEDEPEVEAWESYVLFRAVIFDVYTLDSSLIIYNTSSPFALLLCNLEDIWMSD